MGRKLLVASLVAAAAVLALAFGLRSKAIYSVGVSYFLAHDMADQQVRVKGMLVHGSLCKVQAECGYRFSIQERRLPPPAPAEQLSVSYDACIIPDTFRDMPAYDIEVQVEGERCQTCHDFAASSVIAKSGGGYKFGPHEPLVAAPIPRCQGRAPGT